MEKGVRQAQDVIDNFLTGVPFTATSRSIANIVAAFISLIMLPIDMILGLAGVRF